MSASEIIEQIEALPDQEQALVFDYIVAKNRNQSDDAKPEPIEAVHAFSIATTKCFAGSRSERADLSRAR